jgi:signal transduction histidine kinase
MTIGTDRDRFAAILDRLTALLDGSRSVLAVPREVVDRAKIHALKLRDEPGSVGEGAALFALLGFVAELLNAVTVDLAAHPQEARSLIGELEQISGIPRTAIGRELLRSPELPQLSTGIAIEVQLALLLALADVRAVSLWALWPTGDVKRLSHAGLLDTDAPESRRLARLLLTGEGLVSSGPGADIGITLGHLHYEPAALIAHGAPRGVDHRRLLLEAAAPALSVVLERDHLLEGGSPPDEGVMAAVERRLARLRFDLHDGPQQDVHLLETDLELFRQQLEPLVAAGPDAGRVAQQLDGLAAQLSALDRDLRRLSTSVQSPFLQTGSLPDALRQITDSFAARTNINPRIRLSGEFSKLTDSQQIALLALVTEALSNVRQHSEARHVTISMSADPSGVEAQIVDDGRGFDPEMTLVRAARDGHLGLVGMHERVRFLGGSTQVDSRPGGPTIITVKLPAWPAQPGIA